MKKIKILTKRGQCLRFIVITKTLLKVTFNYLYYETIFKLI